MGKHSPQSFKGVREVKMRIGWDCQPFFWAKTGIYWYWYYLLKELSKITREDSLFLFGFNPRGKSLNYHQGSRREQISITFFQRALPAHLFWDFPGLAEEFFNKNF